MSALFRPPSRPGLRSLEPEIARIVEALARAQEERDHRPPGENSFTGEDYPRDDPDRSAA